MFNALQSLDRILHNLPYPPYSAGFLRQLSPTLSRGGLGLNYLEIASSCCRSATVSPQSQVPLPRLGETRSGVTLRGKEVA